MDQHSQFKRPSPNSFDTAQIPPELTSPEPSAAPGDIGRVVALLEAQNVWLEHVAVMLRAERAERPMLHVKIEDINVPFWHLVGLIAKINLASSPLVVIGLVLLGIGVALCGGATLLAALGNVLRPR